MHESKKDKWKRRSVWLFLLLLLLLAGITLRVEQPKPIEPVAEICNGLDDDYNRKIDDGLIRECTSSCGSGVEVCLEGKWLACSAPTANPTAPDCDYNCDGKSDVEICCEEGSRKEETFCPSMPRDIVWVVDISESMNRSDPLGLARSGLTAIVDELNPGDRASVVLFNHEAQALGALTAAADAPLTLQRAGAMPNNGGTELGLAIHEAQKLFDDPYRRRIVWLLTDGVSEGDPILAAQILKSSRIQIVALGLGPYADMVTLSAVATDRGAAFHVQRAEDIRAAYERTMELLKYESWMQCTGNQWEWKTGKCNSY